VEDLVHPRTKESKMATATLPTSELEDELRHIRNLDFIRDLLQVRGASAAEVADCDAVIEDARARLAASARREAGSYASAA
jgi:hypothetical protein